VLLREKLEVRAVKQ